MINEPCEICCEVFNGTKGSAGHVFVKHVSFRSADMFPEVRDVVCRERDEGDAICDVGKGGQRGEGRGIRGDGREGGLEVGRVEGDR